MAIKTRFFGSVYDIVYNRGHDRKGEPAGCLSLMIVENVLQLMGNTPMLKLARMNPNPNVEMYLKLEKFTPGGSVKDRIAKYMIEHAEADGVLTKDKIVIEPTSGNTGIGLAIVCAVKGYKLVLVMPETMTMERRKMLMIYGARIVLSPGTKGMNGAEDLAKKIVEENPGRYFMPNQFANRYNVLAHYETTAEEVWKDTKGRITHFVGGIGTSGTLMGVAKKLRQYNPDIKVIAVEPESKTPIQGLKNLEIQYVPSIFESNAVDERHYVNLQTAEDKARLLALEEAILCGPSTGAILHVALEKAKTLAKGVIVVMAPDGGEKYLSTQLCDEDKCRDCVLKYKIKCAYSPDVVLPGIDQ
jgi:cysteine synthase